jgi:hypothetical protein
MAVTFELSLPSGVLPAALTIALLIACPWCEGGLIPKVLACVGGESRLIFCDRRRYEDKVAAFEI